MLNLSRPIAAAVLLLGFGPLALAATDLADTPINSTRISLAKPNIMLLMDASISMNFTHAPDQLEGTATPPPAAQPIGYRANQCNSLYYNPATVYKLPVDATGANLPTPVFSAARYNHYSSDASVRDLNSAFRAFDQNSRARNMADANDVAQRAYYYVYSGTAALSYNSAPCTDAYDPASANSAATVAALGGQWRRVLVGDPAVIGGTLDERQNFANWYAYYRSRIALVKSGVGLAFGTLSDRFRVGFITANPLQHSPGVAPVAGSSVVAGTVTVPGSYVPLADFDVTQKNLWYFNLYAQSPEGTSPMREGLARVGRHYADQHDAINRGMPETPSSHSCQQNFTIMTTDGYWNRAAETLGPVKIDGSTLIGQQDGVLSDSAGNTPRPIWDGGTTGSTVTTDNWNTYSTAACDSHLVTRNTAQSRASTTQVNRSTAQQTQSTLQVTQSTAQLSQSTSQTNASTVQVQQTITQATASTVTIKRATRQVLQSTAQLTSSTSNATQWTEQINTSTSALTQSTAQVRQSTSQTQQSSLQHNLSTTQTRQSTSQLQKTTSQATQSTSQWWSYVNEAWTPVAGCGGSSGTCAEVTTGPTQVVPGSCVVQAGNAGNSYQSTSCVNTASGPSGAASCAVQTAVAGNGFVEISCNTVTTGPTPVASCTVASANAGNNYTATSCPVSSSGPTPVAACTAAAANAGNSYTATLCSDVATGPTPVAVCTPLGADAGNNFTATSCNTALTGPVPVASCSASGAASVAPYLVISCNAVTTTSVPVASCTPSGGAAPNWTAVTCATASTGPTPAPTCTPASANAGNGFVATTCSANSSGPTGVAACASDPASAGNSYTAISCNTVNNGPSGVSSCTAAPADASNGFTSTSCAPNNTGPTGVASCTAASASTGNNWTSTTCSPAVTTGPTPGPSCTAAIASAGNGWTSTTCNTVKSTVANVGTCTPDPATALNNWTATFCGTYTSPVAGAPACVPSATVTCNNVSTGPTAVASCTPQAAAAGNNWTETTCNTVTTGPTAVEQCIPINWDAYAAYYHISPTLIYAWYTGPGGYYANQYAPQPGTGTFANGGQWYYQNNYTQTICSTDTTPYTPVASCTAAGPLAGNGYVKTQCNSVVTGPTGVQSCSAELPTAGNNYQNLSCNTVTTGPTGVAACTPQVGDAGNQWLTRNCATATTGPTLVASCSNAPAAAGNGYVATSCNTTSTGPTPVASCLPSAAALGNNFVSTRCDNVTTAAIGVASCTPLTADAGNSYTATLCNVVATGPTPVAACAPAAADMGNSFTGTSCNTVSAGPTPVLQCTPSGVANAGNAYTLTSCDVVSTGPDQVAVGACTPGTDGRFVTTTCAAVPGQKLQYFTHNSVSTQALSGGIDAGPPVLVSSDSATVDLDGVCYPPRGTPARPALFPAPTARPVAVTTASESSLPAPVAPCLAWPCVVNLGTTTGGSANSLADVAQYYYVTDLRPDLVDNVFLGGGTGPEDDRLKSQHMTTFAVGLGVSGTLDFRADYPSGAGDFAALRSGAKGWPVWPTATATTEAQLSDPRSIDDFWHAAVNGRGRFFSAKDPDSMIFGIAGALSSIDSASGSGAGATSATQNPILGSNSLFSTGFVTGKWTGDVQGRRFTATGVTGAAADWSARDQLDLKVAAQCDRRDIRLIRPGAANNLARFTWGTQSCDAAGVPTGAADTDLNAAEQAFFGATAANSLSQFDAAGTSTPAQRSAAANANLVNFLRGQKGQENYLAADVNRLYRVRDHALGDIVNSQLIYVEAPTLAYADTGYAAFKASRAGRAGMAYVGGNDGMLHAFYTAGADAGKEAWAVIPTSVLPNLYQLADVAYGSHHQYFVDGSPTSADVHTASGGWKSILVGGLNKGGRGYYALDISDPTAPKALWEFKAASSGCAASNAGAVGNSADCNLGLSYGRPVVTKLADGSWVVLVTSGYNNTGAGDGQGYLYVLDAGSGRILKRIATGAGDTSAPSGLRELTTFVSNPLQDNSALRVYGGDLLGNLWRFDINASSDQAVLITTLTSPSDGQPQPISTRINLAEIDGSTYLLVGTGRLLGISDISDSQRQSVYSIRDPMGASGTQINAVSLRAGLKALQLTTTGTAAPGGNFSRSAGCTGATPAQCSGSAGWYVDLTEPGERVSVDMGLDGGTLVFQSNVPSASACSTGYNLFNFFDFVTGESVYGNTGQVSSFGHDALATGTSLLNFPPGSPAPACESMQSITNADGSIQFSCVPQGIPPPLGKRISWRELVQ